jgi:tetratricopeptide (TPR) repeat protein
MGKNKKQPKMLSILPSLDRRGRTRLNNEARTPFRIRKMSDLSSKKQKLEAELLSHQKALSSSTTKNGEMHRDTLTSNHNVAVCHQRLSNLTVAREMLHSCFKNTILHFGPEDPDSLAVQSSLAGVLYAQGEYKDALELHKDCLEKRSRVLGVDHADTLMSLNNVASVHYAQGEYKDALELYKNCLEKRSRVLGADHADTLMSLNNVASVHYAQGEYKDALELHKDCLKERSRVLGVDHADTLMSLNNVASVHYAQGEYKDALELHEDCLEQRSRVLGADHADTLMSLNNVALAFVQVERCEDAIPYFELCLKERSRVLGADHPDTLETLNNLAFAFILEWDNEAASELIKTRCPFLSKDDPKDLMHLLPIDLDRLLLFAISQTCRKKYKSAARISKICVDKTSIYGRDDNFTLLATGWLKRAELYLWSYSPTLNPSQTHANRVVKRVADVDFKHLRKKMGLDSDALNACYDKWIAGCE